MNNEIFHETKTARLFPTLVNESSNNHLNDENKQNFVSCPSVASFVAFERDQEKLKNQQKIHFERQKSFLEYEKENSKFITLSLSKSLNSSSQAKSLFPGINDVKGNTSDTDSCFDFVSQSFFENNEIINSRTETTLTPAVTLLDLISTKSLRVHQENIEIPNQTKLFDNIMSSYQNSKPDVVGKTIKLIASNRGH